MAFGAYLVCYDYGQGGVWAMIRAESPDSINASYPELTVFESPPDWMSGDELDRIRATTTLDVTDERHPFLAALLKARRS
jgi:hypothetical protein